MRPFHSRTCDRFLAAYQAERTCATVLAEAKISSICVSRFVNAVCGVFLQFTYMLKICSFNSHMSLFFFPKRIYANVKIFRYSWKLQYPVKPVECLINLLDQRREDLSRHRSIKSALGRMDPQMRSLLQDDMTS